MYDQRFDRIDEKLDELLKSQHQVTVEHSSRITRLETSQRGFISIVSALFTALVSYVVAFVHK